MDAKPHRPSGDALRQPAGVAQPVPQRDIEKASGRTPGGNNLNRIPDKDVDEVMPVRPDDKDKGVDPTGNRRRPL